MSTFFLFLSTSISTKARLVSSHHFFVFTYSDHDNTALVSCLLPKERENILGVLFLSNPTLLFCPLLFPLPLGLSSFAFSIVNVGTYLFIYLVNNISHSSTIQNRVHKFSGAYHETRQNITHKLPNSSSPFFQNIVFNTMVSCLTKHQRFSTPFQEVFTKCWSGY